MSVKSIVHPTTGRAVRLGRRRPAPGRRLPRLSSYLRAAANLPTPPAAGCDYSGAARSILSDVFENDSLGDCVIAGGYHMVGVETSNAGDPFHATSAQITADYSAIGGYVPGDPSTDNGCDEQTALTYWTSTGFANGTRLAGFLAIDATNQQEVELACYLFENVYFGVELPDAWISPFPSGNDFTWDVAGDPDPNNGHCFVGVGYSPSGVYIDTWGLIGTLTWAAIAKYATASAGGELYVLLSPDQIAKAQIKAPNGLDWPTLQADFAAIGGAPAPLPPAPVPPAPPNPTPPPAPIAPSLTLDQAVAALTKGWPTS